MDIQWSLVFFTALTGAAGWMFVCIAIDEFIKKAHDASLVTSIVAGVLAVIGGCASITHLSHPDRVLNALQHPTSGIFIEAILTACVVICAIIYIILVARKANEGARKVLAVLGAVFGIFLSFMSGASYMMEARETWNTFLLPLAYLGTSVTAGVSIYLLFAAAIKKLDDAKPYGWILVIGSVVALITVFAYGIYAGVWDGATISLFIVTLVINGLIPLIVGCIFVVRPRGVLALSITSSVCALAGAITFRCFMWLVAVSLVDFFTVL
ncbi:MAG: DMSO reductase [Eggerthellaceae bacterium]|nr:DMSO reductase [Eggerthellaceae bacterium]